MASAEARGSSTMSWTWRPARLTLRTTFRTEVVAPVTRCTSTSSRTPDMPSGSLTPSWSSTMKVWGKTWMTSRSCGRLRARAASSARSISVWLTSRCLPDTATTPRLFTPRIWPPATPAITEAISTPAISSASPTARLMDSTVESILTTTPFRRPREGFVPTPTISRFPSGDHSAMTQQILVVPTSSPAITLRPLALGIGLPHFTWGLRTTWSRKRRSMEATASPVARSCASTPWSRPSLASHSSLPSRTSTPSIV